MVWYAALRRAAPRYTASPSPPTRRDNALYIPSASRSSRQRVIHLHSIHSYVLRPRIPHGPADVHPSSRFPSHSTDHHHYPSSESHSYLPDSLAFVASTVRPFDGSTFPPFHCSAVLPPDLIADTLSASRERPSSEVGMSSSMSAQLPNNNNPRAVSACAECQQVQYQAPSEALCVKRYASSVIALIVPQCRTTLCIVASLDPR
jgi:hypothetical protein